MRHALTAIMAAVSFSSIATAQTADTPVAAAPPAQSEIGAAIAKDMDGLMALYATCMPILSFRKRKSTPPPSSPSG